MKFESPNTPEQENHTQFYSSDPYEVLGVSRTSSEDDISDTRKRLLRKFHPDINNDPKSTEISQNINQAYNKIIGKNTNSRIKNSPPKHSSHKKPDQNQSAKQASSERAKQKEHTESSGFKERKKETPVEIIENKLFSILTLSPSYFVGWVSEAKVVGVTSERIEELIKSEEAQKVLKRKFLSEVEIWGGDNPNHCIKYVEEWKKVGIDLNSYFESPKVKKILEKKAIDYKIKIYGAKNPNKFLDFVEAWKKVGIDVSKVVEQPEVIEYLTDQIIDVQIKIWGDPERFLSFVKEWKKANINLEEVVNSPEAQQALTETAKNTIRFRPNDFKPFVKKWIEAGWKPNQEIMKLYGN